MSAEIVKAEAPATGLEVLGKLGQIVSVNFGPGQVASKVAASQSALAAAEALDASGAGGNLTQAQADELAALRVGFKSEIDAIEGMRTPVTSGLLALKAMVDGWFVPSRNAYQGAYDALGRVIARFVDANAQKAREALQAAAEAHNAGDHETGAALTAIVSEAAAAKAPVGTSVRFEWRADVVDASALVRGRPDLTCPDVKAIGKMAKALNPDMTPDPVPGLSFTRVPVTTTRRKKDQ